MASTRNISPANSSQGKPSTPPQKFLHKYSYNRLLVTLLFLFFLVVPWVFFAVLSFRPIGGTDYQAKSWQDVSGNIYESVVYTSNALYRASDIFYIIAAVLTFPILSMLLNHAAVVVVQRRHPNQRVNAAQMLALADAPWSRLPSKLSISLPNTRFACGGIALVALSFLQLILQSALVTWEEVRVATNRDVPNTFASNEHTRSSFVGYDSTTYRMSHVPASIVTKEVAARLSTESKNAAQPRLWYDGGSGPDYNGLRYDNPSLFAAAFPTSTNTGVLRYHAMRLNTSVQCDLVSRDNFPETCPGPLPFHGNLSLPSRRGEDDPAIDTPEINISWCVPGNFSASPWPRIRDRQDITEEMFIDVSQSADSYSYGAFNSSFTTRCTANTTRGYFELPNSHNKFMQGPLLEKWTETDLDGTSRVANDEADNVEDYLFLDWDYLSNFPYGNNHSLTPGPLTTAMLSMLGNESWIVPLQNITEGSDSATLRTIYRDMCTGGIPFLTWGDSARGFNYDQASCILDDESLHSPLYSIKSQTYHWFSSFSDTGVSATLAAATFFANEATLTRSSEPHGVYSGAGVIYTAPGAIMHKPVIPLAALIVISILIGTEVFAIIFLVSYISRNPTFTNRLDALAVATVGAQLSAAGVQLPPLHEPREARYEKLREHDGVIGLSHGSLTDEEAGRPGPSGKMRNIVASDEEQLQKTIVVGGNGLLKY
ncbi:hypothetical protein F5B22DRAFT_624192 [Xylaria bambusicola]|uniref:uncharacterized protein n=1 Tax=Xylaria bambusicola TaxID=326684 RepID=UPI002008E0C8|nr:uncharacterized protein F5B22DRAFT_624192 [Xylaria bambusicola]KAI0506418.1 hypothetical protein F5B22DRAFT_624192 [Xylaria bambusicola]